MTKEENVEKLNLFLRENNTNIDEVTSAMRKEYEGTIQKTSFEKYLQTEFSKLSPDVSAFVVRDIYGDAESLAIDEIENKLNGYKQIKSEEKQQENVKKEPKKETKTVKPDNAVNKEEKVIEKVAKIEEKPVEKEASQVETEKVAKNEEKPIEKEANQVETEKVAKNEEKSIEKEEATVNKEKPVEKQEFDKNEENVLDPHFAEKNDEAETKTELGETAQDGFKTAAFGKAEEGGNEEVENYRKEFAEEKELKPNHAKKSSQPEFFPINKALNVKNEEQPINSIDVSGLPSIVQPANSVDLSFLEPSTDIMRKVKAPSKAKEVLERKHENSAEFGIHIYPPNSNKGNFIENNESPVHKSGEKGPTARRDLFGAENKDYFNEFYTDMYNKSAKVKKLDNRLQNKEEMKRSPNKKEILEANFAREQNRAFPDKKQSKIYSLIEELSSFNVRPDHTRRELKYRKDKRNMNSQEIIKKGVQEFAESRVRIQNSRPDHFNELEQRISDLMKTNNFRKEEGSKDKFLNKKKELFGEGFEQNNQELENQLNEKFKERLLLTSERQGH